MKAEARKVFKGLFPNDPPKGRPLLEIMPVSIIELERGKKNQSTHVRKSFEMSKSSRANYSPFPREVAMLSYEFYLRDCKTIFDPFAGWGERHYYAKAYGKTYTGYDTSPTAIRFAKEQFGVDNTLGNSCTKKIQPFDGLLTCPPYWNIEQYDGEDGIDTCNDWEGFIDLLGGIFRRCIDAANPGATFCIMAGDWRAKGFYYDLMYRIEQIFKDHGALVHDKTIVSRKALTPIQFYLPVARKHRFTVKMHEYLTVFRKPGSSRVRIKQ